MRASWSNVLLLILLLAQIVTGYLALTNGRFAERWTVWLHGAGAYAILVLLVWKGQVIADALRRKNVWSRARYIFFFLLLLLILTILSGIVWTIWGPIHWAGFSLVSLHIYVAIPLIVLMAWHAWRQRFVLRLPESRDRRLFLRGASLAVAGTLVWGAMTWLRRDRGLATLPRRFTGSYETGSFTGQFPTVSWIADSAPRVDLQSWRFSVHGTVQTPRTFSYNQLLELAEDEITAVLDCTGGWYSEQVWRGIRVERLLERAGMTGAAASMTFQSLTGYKRRFARDEAGTFVLALFVAGEALSEGHGFPVRLVAPGYRGYDWVKWVNGINVQTGAAFWQSPLPLQ